jgi:putative transferase (TIGR04331 family)
MEETWPTEGSPILFLGEWCRLYSRKSKWEHLDAKVAPYHWDDREKLHRDYLYLQDQYEMLLEELSSKLNSIHGVDHTVRYWRIIVGPWLAYFIQMLFDRWAMLQQVITTEEIASVRAFQVGFESLIQNDFEEFQAMMVTDEWNEAIYIQLLELSGISIEWMRKESHISAFPPSLPSRIKKVIKKIAHTLSGLVSRKYDYFFISSYLGAKQELFLQLRLGQLPKYWWKIQSPVSTPNAEMRKWKINKSDNFCDFTEIARSFIPSHIPKIYLEGYKKSATLINKLPWPKKPKVIFTANSYSSDDIFKIWAAGKVEDGAPLVIAQHGGNMGMAAWADYERHQIMISDYFITWGWQGYQFDNNKIAPIGMLKPFDQSLICDPDGPALIVGTTIPRFSYHMYSCPVASQWHDYFEDQFRFANALPHQLQQQLLVRLYPSDYGWAQRQRWCDRFPNIGIDDGNSPITSLMKKSRLYISTYNATTFLESLSINFPTIIFWNPKHWELRDTASPYFERLKSAGIFHETPESAAMQMALVWDDIAGWWQSELVQAARQHFCDVFARSSNKPLDGLEATLRNIASGRALTADISNENVPLQ